MHISIHHIKDDSWSIGVQIDTGHPMYFYSAIYISTDGISFNFYPCVRTFDEINELLQIDELLRLGLFKPASPQQKNALSTHNLKHYKPSFYAEALFKAPNKVSGLEQSAEEQNYMNENGIAFCNS